MEILQQILFWVLCIFSIGFFAKRIGSIRRNILLGQRNTIAVKKTTGLKQLLLLAFGQKKMFKNPLVAVLHLIIYAGFLIINIEMIEIILDGLMGTHRVFLSAIPGVYNLLINSFEVLAASVVAVCFVFLARRNMMIIDRFKSDDLKGPPTLDANIILVAEIILMLLFLLMNAADTSLQLREQQPYADHSTGPLIISSMLHPLMDGLETPLLVLLERCCWWMHIAGVFTFLNYLTWSKHLHIILAFPNAYFANPKGAGKIQNMKAVQQEVWYGFDPSLVPIHNETPTIFGAKDIQDLGWKNILDAYSCTECGRCSAVCPATQTGKRLSPRKIMMDTRDRAEEMGRQIDKTGKIEEDGKSLLYDKISEEELRACTTCDACVEACPVSINPLDIIIQLRRYLIMEKSSAPQEWNLMFGNIENNFAPWKVSPEDRISWNLKKPL